MDIIGNFLLISSIAEAELPSASSKGFGFNSNFLEANVINIVILASGVFYLGRNFLSSALELRQQKTLKLSMKLKKDCNKLALDLLNPKNKWLKQR